MLLRIFLRWLGGSVHFSAAGGFAERFLNLARQADIELWDTQLRGGVLYSFVSGRNYRRLRHIARQSGMQIRVCRKLGLPFLILSQRRHAGMLVGFCFFALLFFTLSTRIWIINIDENNITERRIIVEELKKNGVSVGSRRSKLDVKTLSKEMTDCLPQLNWIGINLRGSELEVRIREHSIENRKPVNNKPADIVATQDGRLVSQLIWAGTRLFTEGAAFEKGDVLVEGRTRNTDESTTPIRASAYIVAETERLLEQEQSSAPKALRRQRLRRQFTLRIFGLRLPLFVKSWENAWESVNQLSMNDVLLPIGIDSRSLPIFAEDDTLLTSENAELLALSKLHAKAVKLLEHKEIRSLKNTREDTDGVHLRTTYILWENVGEIKE
ncbi:MAG: sporulation protein YqfD [Oscillospiraceae bacterium]|nr:sporulation protein YqfD [Oscillospiraceae bacterium]